MIRLNLPNGWKIEKLYDCLEGIIDYRGKSTPKDKSGYQLITARNVRFGYIDFEPKEYMNHSDYKEWMTRGFPKLGDVLFTTEAPLGNCALYPSTGTYALAQRLVTLRTNKEILDSDYLLFFLLSDYGQNQVKIRATGSTATGIRQSELRKVPVILPPLPEQRKIAEILRTWGEAITLTEKLIAAIQLRKKGLIQILLAGEVRFPEFVISRQTRPSSGTQIPNDWKVYEFGKLATMEKKKYNPKTNTKSYPCIELEHISQETGKILGYVSAEQQKSTKNFFLAGQVLFGKLRPYLKKYAHPDFDGVCSSEIWVLSGKDGICDNQFLFYLVQSDQFLNVANVTSGTKMPRSDWSFVSESAFTLPPIPEQKKISSVLKACDYEIDFLTQMIETQSKQKKVLMQRLLFGQIRVRGD